MFIMKTETENYVRIVTIRTAPQEFTAALSKAYLDRAEEYVVPGFAAGLAPRKALEQTYGHALLYDEALDLCIPELFGRYVKEEGVRIVGKPQVTDVVWQTDGVVDFTVKADLYPEVTLGAYKGLSASWRHEHSDDLEARAVQEAGRCGASEADDADFAQAVLKAACSGMTADVTDAMVEQKLNAMAAQEKLNVYGDAIYHVLADTVEILSQAYRDAGVSRPAAQVRAEAMDVMLETVSGDHEKMSKEHFAEQIKNLVRQYRTPPDDFDDRLAATIKTIAGKKATRTTEEQAGEVFRAYLGSLNLNEKEWRAERRLQAAATVRVDLLLDAVAEAEQLTVDEQEIKSALSGIAAQSGMEIEEIQNEIDVEPIKWQILREKAYKLIVESAISVADA